MPAEAIYGWHTQDLKMVVDSVFSTMMGLEARPGSGQWPEMSGMLTGAVYLTGSWKGAIFVHCLPADACRFAGRFLGIDPPDLVDDDVRDVIGEIANMIAGNLKCAVAKGIRVSVPSVVDGPGYSVRVCGGRMLSRIAFDTSAGPLWLTLMESEE